MASAPTAHLYAPPTGLPGDDCPADGGTTTASTYDTADQLTTSGYVYDTFSRTRTTSVPGHGTIAYYTNDLVRRQTANGQPGLWTPLTASAPGPSNQ